MATDQTDILKQFISDEASVYLKGEQGAYWPSNHHRITPAVARAPKLLSEPERIELYFHLLRLNGCPVIKLEREFDLLLEAYSRLAPLFERGYPYCSLKRPKGLFLFGADDHGPLIEREPTTHAMYLSHEKFWRYADSFWHMPGMLKKREKFVDLANDEVLVDRATRVLLRMNLVTDLTTTHDIWFWSLILLVLQQKDSGSKVVEHLVAAKYPRSVREKILGNLARYIRASEGHHLLARWHDVLPLDDET